MNEKIVSVVVTVFNGQAKIKKCLQSIISQSYSEIELVIFDDGSTDCTRQEINEFINLNRHYKYKFLYADKNIGRSNALNECIKNTTGEYIAVMDADDEMYKARISSQVQYLINNPSTIVVGGSQLMLFGDESSRVNRPPLKNDLIKAGLFVRTTMLHPTIMLRKDFLDKNNIQYDPNYYLCEDYKLFVDLLYAGANFSNIPEVVNTYDYSSRKSWDKHQDLMVNALQNLWAGNLQKIGMKYGNNSSRYFLQATGKLEMHQIVDIFKVFFFFVTCICCNKGYFGGVIAFAYMRVKDIRFAIFRRY